MERARLEELIQAQLEGELSAAERADLARVLLQDAGARRLHDEFVRIDRLLRDIPPADPPPGLREYILAGTAPPDRSAGPGNPRRWVTAQRLAAAVAGGLLIVGLAYVLSDGRGPVGELQGSLQGGRGPDIPESVAQVSRASLQADGIVVEGLLRRDGGTLRLELGSSAQMPAEVAVRFDPALTSFAGSAVGASLASVPGEIVVRLPAGRQRTVLDFSGAAPTELEVRAGGRILGTAEFALNGS
jgi:hypothetical protein